MSHVKRKGPWVEEKSIGSGGFGEVTLWKNEVQCSVLKYSI